MSSVQDFVHLEESRVKAIESFIQLVRQERRAAGYPKTKRINYSEQLKSQARMCLRLEKMTTAHLAKISNISILTLQKWNEKSEIQPFREIQIISEPVKAIEESKNVGRIQIGLPFGFKFIFEQNQDFENSCGFFWKRKLVP